MNTTYHKILRAILGLKNGSSRIGTLVRGGWLPLHYELALRGLVIYYKIQLNKSGDGMFTQYSEFKQEDEFWESTRIYEPCERIIRFFDDFTEEGTPDLLSFTSAESFKRELKSAMFRQLSEFWSSHPGSACTHEICPKWEPRFLTPYNVSRRTESFYYRLAFTQNDLKPFLHSIHRATEDTCRACSNATETTTHIFFSCPHYKSEQKRLMNACTAQKIDFTKKALLSSPEIKHAVELFLKKTVLAISDKERQTS